MSDLQAPTLVAAMLAAQVERRSGVFDVHAEGVHTHVYFTNGSLVFAEQGTLGDTLGRVLVREGKLSNDQYTAAIRHMTEQLSDSEQMRFGEVVVELGFLKPEDVHAALAAQVRHKAVRCLMYETPEWTFQETQERFSVGHFPSTVEPLVLAATILFEEPRIERILNLDRTRYPRLTTDADSIVSTFQMTPAQRRFVALVDGSTSTHMLVGGKYGDLQQADAVLAALVLAGYAKLTSEPTAVRRRPTSVAPPPALAGPPAVIAAQATPPKVEPSASRAVPPAAVAPKATGPKVEPSAPRAAPPVAVAPKATPPKVEPSAAPAVAPGAHGVAPAKVAISAPAGGSPAMPAAAPARVVVIASPAASPAVPATTTAGGAPIASSAAPPGGRALSPPTPAGAIPAKKKVAANLSPKTPFGGLWVQPLPTQEVQEPVPTDPRAAKVAAEAAFQRAKDHLKDHVLARALPELHRAVTLCPDSIEFNLCLKWAEFTDQVTEKGRAARREALKRLAHKAVKQDPNLALGFFVLGQLAMLEGEDASVPIRLFKHALRLDPDLLDAERNLRVATMRKGRPAGPPPMPSDDDDDEPGDRRSVVSYIVEAFKRTKPAPHATTDAESPATDSSPALVEPGDERDAPPSSRQVPAPPAPVEPASTPEPPPPPPEPAPPVAPLPKETPSARELAPADTPSSPEVASVPGTSVPEAAMPELARPEPAESQPAKPELVKPDPAKPEPVARRPVRAVTQIVVFVAVAAVSAVVGAWYGAHRLTPTGHADHAPLPVTSRVAPAPSASQSPVAPVSPRSTDAPRVTPPQPPTSATAVPPPTSAAPTASAVPATPAAPTEADATQGTLRMPPSARGHRVFLDGHLVGEATEDLRVPCGSHVVKVGSAGAEKSVVVPCGGSVSL